MVMWNFAKKSLLIRVITKHADVKIQYSGIILMIDQKQNLLACCTSIHELVCYFDLKINKS